MQYSHYLFDWGNTLMEDLPGQTGPMFSWPEIRIVHGADKVLRQLSQQGKCYIATNAEDSSATQIWQALQRAGIHEFISDIFCFQETGFKKPEPEFFEAIINSLNICRTSIVMIGDSLCNDVYGAQAAGIDAIWFNRYGEACPEGVKSIFLLDELCRASGA